MTYNKHTKTFKIQKQKKTIFQFTCFRSFNFEEGWGERGLQWPYILVLDCANKYRKHHEY